MTKVPNVPGFAIDANVVIDYVKTDIRILTLVSRRIAPIYLASPTLVEIEQLSSRTATQHGLHIVEPSLQQTEAALVDSKGRISFQDRLCAIVARDNAWTCLTNDTNLRKYCSAIGVAYAWGLEPMRWLVDIGQIRSSTALAVAKRIAQVNNYLTADIIGRFRNQIGL